ncbi:MAG: cobalamin biosynthesis protein P47K [Firmicutes bacterium]|nr:cobalamin biosynthesis protein P47K [Bacillota bacterium]
MKTIILGGFLGSGKTTVLLQLARYITDRPDFPQVVILENEIGEVGVDNQILQGAALSVENVFSGCICCSGAVDLISAVQSISSLYDPDWLLIEATGMALPSAIEQTLRDVLGIDAAVLAVADASRWKKLIKVSPDFVTGQVGSADMVLLTKIDKLDADDLADVAAQVKRFSGNAEVFPVCALDPINTRLFGELMDFA